MVARDPPFHGHRAHGEQPRIQALLSSFNVAGPGEAEGRNGTAPVWASCRNESRPSASQSARRWKGSCWPMEESNGGKQEPSR